MTDEEYVRSRWDVYVWQSTEKEHFVDLLHSGDAEHGAYTFPAATEAKSWSAAAEFMCGREAQIRLVEEEIKQMQTRIGLYSGDAGKIEAAIVIDKRILAREQAALESLKKGMRP